MNQPRKPQPAARKEESVKVAMKTLAAGPIGVARPGDVLDIPNEQAEQWKKDGYARDYDREKDAKAHQGLRKPPEKFE